MPDMKRMWILAPYLEVLYNSGVVMDWTLNPWLAVFPMCTSTTTSSSTPPFDIACLTAAFASIDPYCEVCNYSSGSTCHYPPAFTYTPGGMTGTDLYCPAGVTADNINRFHSLGYLIDEPAFYNLGPWDAIPDTVLTQADIAEILTIYPHCATDPAGQNPCLMGEFTRIRHELMTCVIDPNMGGSGDVSCSDFSMFRPTFSINGAVPNSDGLFECINPNDMAHSDWMCPDPTRQFRPWFDAEV
jgi:hypothetical protein